MAAGLQVDIITEFFLTSHLTPSVQKSSSHLRPQINDSLKENKSSFFPPFYRVYKDSPLSSSPDVQLTCIMGVIGSASWFVYTRYINRVKKILFSFVEQICLVIRIFTNAIANFDEVHTC